MKIKKLPMYGHAPSPWVKDETTPFDTFDSVLHVVELARRKFIRMEELPDILI